LPPLKISYEDFSKILIKTKHFIDGVNDSSKYTTRSELSISNNNNSTTYNNIEDPNIFRDAPKVAHKAYYYFTSYDNKISELSIDFNDYSRSISVEGKSYENCKALISLLESEFQQYSLTFSGALFRIWGGIILFLIAQTIMWIPLFTKAKETYVYYISMFIGIMLLISIYIMPWENWFSGFKLYFVPQNILEEYSGIISIIGIIITIITSLISIYRGKKNIHAVPNIKTQNEINEDAN